MRHRANILTDDAVFKRPRALVERELEARIEAQTAPRFLQRRRAAKTARRIASLPPSLFESAVVVEPGTDTWNAMSSPAVIDIPLNAIHETPRNGELPAEAEVIEVIEVIEAIELIDVVEAVESPDAGNVIEVVEVVELIDVVEAVEDVEAAPIVQTAEAAVPALSLFTPDAVSEAPAVADDPYDWEADVAVERDTRVSLIPERWRTWKARPLDSGTAPPAAISPEPPDPLPPRRRRGRIEPHEVAPAAHAPRGAENWQPSESLWARRVFNSSAHGADVASWPRPRPPKQDVSAGE